ncbi:hypothetical protein GGS20DRAFT_585131 [Poronia punctata]|nr:hypothetical protein GGS20DRAFT_585131 [Poronia punctata]
MSGLAPILGPAESAGEAWKFFFYEGRAVPCRPFLPGIAPNADGLSVRSPLLGWVTARSVALVTRNNHHIQISFLKTCQTLLRAVYRTMHRKGEDEDDELKEESMGRHDYQINGIYAIRDTPPITCGAYLISNLFNLEGREVGNAELDEPTPDHGQAIEAWDARTGSQSPGAHAIRDNCFTRPDQDIIMQKYGNAAVTRTSEFNTDEEHQVFRYACDPKGGFRREFGLFYENEFSAWRSETLEPVKTR